MSHPAISSQSPPSVRSKRSLALVRSVSDTAVLLTAFATGISLCANASLANIFLFKLGGAASDFLVRCNQFFVLAVIFLLWKLLRWGRERNELLHERNELLRERNEIIVQLNDSIRNACQAILLSEARSGERVDTKTVTDSVLRIERALDKYIPNPFVVRGPAGTA